MNFFETLQIRIARIEKKRWYQYLAAAAAIIFLLAGIIFYFYYSSISRWQARIEEINDSRAQARRLLAKAQMVQKDKEAVTRLLAEDPNFKIKAYIQDILEKVGMRSNVLSDKGLQVSATEDSYREEVVTYQLGGITMKQLTEFLNEIDNNPRIYVKELEISKSKRVPRTVDVDIKIATMMPKEST